MSGPKYYSFNITTNSPEEAAGTYAQLSSFHPGAQVTVENNRIRVTIADTAISGLTEANIRRQIANAQTRYRENEELKRLLEEGKENAVDSIRKKEKDVKEEYKREKSKLETSKQRCEGIEREASVSYTTPFGSYDLNAELAAVQAAKRVLSAEYDSLDQRKQDCLKACADAELRITSCASLKELEGAKRMIEGIGLSPSGTADSVEELEGSVKEKAARLNSFVGFLDKLYEGMSRKNLMGYMRRIKQEVASIDAFDAAAGRKLQGILTQLESEIMLLQKAEEAKVKGLAIDADVQAQLRLLRELCEALQPILKDIDVQTVTTADHTEKNTELLRECEQLVERINALEFVGGRNGGEVDRIANVLAGLRDSVRSEATLRKLQGLLAQLQMQQKICEKENEQYQEFTAEYKRYEELYVKLQGILSGLDPKKMRGCDELLSPLDVYLKRNEAPEAQTARLRTQNEELEEVLRRFAQELNCNAVVAAVATSSWGKGFKRERREDGSLRFTYVREDCRGMIFDVICTKDGKMGIYPRGVVLCNGKRTASADDLKRVHSSCEWAEQIHDRLSVLGMTECGSYEEMGDEALQELYDESHYYHLQTRKESIFYLQLVGYSEEEIAELLDSEGTDVGDDVEEDDVVTGEGHAE